jgi:hypothetical protein
MTIDRHLLAVITLAGMLLDVLGGLYLAYDLLGGSGGPLATLTRWVSYSLAFGLAYGVFLGPIFGFVAGPAFGLALALELGRRDDRGKGRFLARTLPFGLYRGLVLGISAGLALGWRFGLVFAPLSALGLLGAYAIGASPAQVHQGGGRAGYTWRRVRATATRALAVGLAGLAAGLVVGESAATLRFAVEIGILIGIVGGILGAMVPLVESRAARLPPRWLGTFGVVLLLLGVLLQSLQYWTTLLNVPVV